jgi:formylglycine-generating enzyme
MRGLFLAMLSLGCQGESVVGAPADAATDAVAARCANGVVEKGEACDDGNELDGDGCSRACAIDPGYKCASGSGTSICVPLQPRSCAGGSLCGAVSCCDSKRVAGGTFPLGRGATGAENDVCSTWAAGGCLNDETPAHEAKVSTFMLDTFEVSVSRFRKFVEAYPESKPKPGAGAHPWTRGSGWQPAWNGSLPADRTALIAALHCSSASPSYETWTDSAGPHERKPINCVDWYLAFAFCAWDSGRLPTEAEWEYAAAGGADNRVLPWGLTSAPTAMHANFGCLYMGSGTCTGVANIAPVGTALAGVGAFGQLDLAGNVWEWNLDWYEAYASAPVSDHAVITSTGATRVIRGGDFNDKAANLRSTHRSANMALFRGATVGVRCARDL